MSYEEDVFNLFARSSGQDRLLSLQQNIARLGKLGDYRLSAVSVDLQCGALQVISRRS